MDHGTSRLSRRRLLALLAAAGVSACSPRDRDAASRAGGPTRSSSPSPTPSPSASPRPSPEAPPEPSPPPEVVAYDPLAGDVLPALKRVGGRFAQELATYGVDEPLIEILSRAAASRRPGLDPGSLAPAAGPVHHEGIASTGEVVYVQLGGLHPAGAPTSASTMVVLLQRLQVEGGERVHTRTLDVRLRNMDGSWVVDGLGDIGGIPLERPTGLPAAAVRVLDDERIDLPDSARWDIYRGEIDERLLGSMAQMAEWSPYSVCCLKSGHPVNVFGTDRRSNHTAGRGVDIWAVGDAAVVHQQPGTDSAAHALARAVFDRSAVPELGAPWSFDPPGGRSFENDVHRDHIHVAYHARR